MIEFDHLSTGTGEPEWRAAGWLAGLDPLPLPRPGDRVVVLAAHPDDETLGAGGLMAACARRQVEVSVIVASDGDASHPDSPTLRPDQLAVLRRDEVRAAVAVLAPGSPVHFLGLPDGDLTRHAIDLRAQLSRLAGGATHLVSPWRHDRHPDHEACADAAALTAAELDLRHWQYPIWAWHWDDPQNPVLPAAALRRVELTQDDELTKQRALDCHVTQHAPLSDAPGDEAILPPAIRAHFTRTFETFITAGSSDASSADYFDELYAGADDPWGLRVRFYETRKRALQLAALPRSRFRRAFEPGCAIGLLTEELAARCDEVVAWDGSARAVELAAPRLASWSGVHLEQARIPLAWPDGEFDLIVLSEVGYYCVELDQLVERVLGSLSDDGVLLACHWRRRAPDHPHTAEAVHDALGARLDVAVSHVEDDFLLHVWTRVQRSVAQADSIVA